MENAASGGRNGGGYVNHPARTDATMTYTTRLALTMSTLASVGAEVRERVAEVVTRHRDRIDQDILAFLARPVSPTGVLEFEHRLAARLREFGRELVEEVCNRLEGDDPNALPTHIHLDGEEYRIVRAKTRQPVDTVFGPITLWRHLYRPVTRDSAEPSIAPLAEALGVVQNTTPGLAEAAVRYLAEAGATQRVVQDRLRTQHGVGIGTGRLRALADHVRTRMAAARPDAQVRRVLELLREADRSSGSRKPVVSVGRDGITLRGSTNGLFEVASAATLTVLDRGGRRLGSVYLAYAPESGQGQMSDQLTRLIDGVLAGWDGPVPRLAYVTDAGENETQYYDRVLRPMTHPRTGDKVEWQRVVDFYHAMERVWALAAALFGPNTPAANGWARRRGRVRKGPNGPFRVLHAAAAVRRGRRPSPTDRDEYRKAYNDLRTRTRWMQYHTYKGQHVPIGSGVTEAACKTIFTQRLKLSGMRWTKAGAQVILDLRVVLLSGIWEDTYRQVLQTYTYSELRTPDRHADIPVQIAA